MGHGEAQETAIGRRVVLGMLGAGVVGVLYGAKAANLLEKVVSPIAAKDGSGLLSSLLPVGRFRIYTVTNDLPNWPAPNYRLTVGGAVANELTLSLDELQAMPPTALTKDFQCVTGWRVSDVKWKGVRLSDVLDRAGASSNAQGVRFISFDGVYTETLTMDQARRNDVIVAYEMEGGPVSRAHGGPVRMFVAPMYGYKSTKWLSKIEVTEGNPGVGYWEVRGYDTDAWVGRSNGRGDDKPIG